MDDSCTHDDGQNFTFCQNCGKVKDRDRLKRCRIMGFVGVANSMSPAVERVFATGEPAPGL